MRPDENYTPLVTIALGLTLTILVVFQIYVVREPTRIQEQAAADHAAMIAGGEVLYAENCASCHGENGQGANGPALNSRELLGLISDEALFSLTRTGVPGTGMPAWGQAFGGPITDEQVEQLVVYIRAWEPDAPEVVQTLDEPDAVRGAAIYARACFVCHGENGSGAEDAPALNDPQRLNRLDDVWYRNTIIRGRPALGMPTWGTVLSPAQISDLVALIGAWREGQTIADATPFAVHIANALYAVQDFDPEDAVFYLQQALAQADETQTQEISEIILLLQDNQLFLAQTQVAALLPPQEMGQALYAINCASCHGDDGTGGQGPNLHNLAFVESRDDETLIAFLLAGRPGTPMDGFEGLLSEDELHNIVVLLRSWQNGND